MRAERAARFRAVATTSSTRGAKLATTATRKTTSLAPRTVRLPARVGKRGIAVTARSLATALPDGSAVLTERCDPLSRACRATPKVRLCAGSCARAEPRLGLDRLRLRATDLEAGRRLRQRVEPPRVHERDRRGSFGDRPRPGGHRRDVRGASELALREHQLAPVFGALIEEHHRRGRQRLPRAKHRASLRLPTHDPASGTSDSAALLPVGRWGYGYVVSSWTGARRPAFVTVVALEDETSGRSP